MKTKETEDRTTERKNICTIYTRGRLYSFFFLLNTSSLSSRNIPFAIYQTKNFN